MVSNCDVTAWMVSWTSLMVVLRCKRIEQTRDQRVPLVGIRLRDAETAEHEGSGREHRCEARERVGRERGVDAAITLCLRDDAGHDRLTLRDPRAQERGEIFVAACRGDRVDKQHR